MLAFSVNVLYRCVYCVCQSCTVYGDPWRGVSTVSTWLDLEEEVGKALWRILDVLTCSTTAIFCTNIQGPSSLYSTVTQCYIEWFRSSWCSLSPSVILISWYSESLGFGVWVVTGTGQLLSLFEYDICTDWINSNIDHFTDWLSKGWQTERHKNRRTDIQTY